MSLTVGGVTSGDFAYQYCTRYGGFYLPGAVLDLVGTYSDCGDLLTRYEFHLFGMQSDCENCTYPVRRALLAGQGLKISFTLWMGTQKSKTLLTGYAGWP
jgi:hypothetical protein